VASNIKKSVKDQQASLAASTALLETLPLLARDWELGESGSDYALSAEIIHGHQAQWEAWARYATLMPPKSPICLYPDLSVLRDVVAPDLARVRDEERTQYHPAWDPPRRRVCRPGVPSDARTARRGRDASAHALAGAELDLRG
jgi:hypothetical protein